MAGQGGLAEQIRAGLEPESRVSVVKAKPEPIHYLDELWVRKPIRRHVAEFSVVIAIVMLLIAFVMAYKDRSLATVAALFTTSLILVALGYRAPALLHPVWKSWMALATGLGIVMTTLILSIGWTLMVVPVALIMKAVSKRVMDLSFDRSVESYWEGRDAKLDDFKLLERQY